MNHVKKYVNIEYCNAGTRIENEGIEIGDEKTKNIVLQRKLLILRNQQMTRTVD